jgi:hypothetical protein
MSGTAGGGYDIECCGTYWKPDLKRRKLNLQRREKSGFTITTQRGSRHVHVKQGVFYNEHKKE